MVWIICFAALAVVALAVVAATGRLGGMRDEPVFDVYEPVLPEHPLTGRDLNAVSLGVTARGYAMDQVDGLLDRLAVEIDTRDREIDTLRAQNGELRASLPADDSPFRVNRPEEPSPDKE